MAMGMDNPTGHEAAEDEEYDEIGVGLNEDGDMVALSFGEWEVELSPAEARDLASALNEFAAEAEKPAS